MPRTYIEAVYVELKRAYGLDPNDVDFRPDHLAADECDGLTPEEVVARIGERLGLERIAEVWPGGTRRPERG